MAQWYPIWKPSHRLHLFAAHNIVPTGGDTLWASGYEIYDRFSKPYQKFFEGLTATFSGEGFLALVAAGKAKLYEKPRGSPQNVGDKLTAIHPVVRTNPVTGWKSIFAIGPFPKRINELTKDESDGVLSMLHQAIIDQHDLQVRFRWKNPNDIGKSLRILFSMKGRKSI